MRCKIIGSALSLLLSCGSALGDGVSFDYLDLGLVSAEFGGYDGDGIAVAASFALDDGWYLAGAVERISTDGHGDILGIEAALGHHWTVGEGTELVVEGGLLSEDHGGSAESGWLALVGLRSMVGAHLELEAAGLALDLGHGMESGYRVGGLWLFSDHWGIVLEHESVADVGVSLLGLRREF